jgi:SAM-dependent methyltransferase
VHDEWAQRYLRDRDAIPYRAQGYEVLMEVLDGRSIERVLDLGTGDGLSLGLLLGMFPDATGVGIDFNEQMLTLASQRFASESEGRVDIVRHDLDESLPELGQFDVVVSSFAIHHCAPERQRELYGEVFDRLRPGGVFVNLEHVASPTPERHLEFLAAIGVTPDDDDPSNQLVETGTQLVWLRDIGFGHVECLWKWRELALLTGTRP